MICGDVHWSQYSSIVRKRSDIYSYRLENLIQSVNWVEDLAEDQNCDLVIYLGDFFDKPDLNAEEITALQDVSWNNSDHFFLVGNHEISRADLTYNSANTFLSRDNFSVVSFPRMVDIDRNYTMAFLPYVAEYGRKNIKTYFTETNKDIILFSHNDIKGVQMGVFKSTEGFGVEEIEDFCTVCFNGHLHNGGKVSKKIINVGNLTGQNFSEDAFVYKHSVVILDTLDMSKAVFDNPFAMNFYHIDFTGKDIDYINEISMMMGKNCVATIKCDEKDFHYLRSRFNPLCREDSLPYNCNMVESKFIVNYSTNNYTDVEDNIDNTPVNHLDKFKSYMLEKYDHSDALIAELQEVCK